MAHMIPESMLEFDPQGREDLVFNALKTGLGDGYWVFHSCSVNQTGRDGAFYEKEIDFVVYHREKGILCLEVKNGSGISYYGGIWRYSSGQPMPHHGPFKQAQLERITICNLLAKRGEETALLKGDERFRDLGRRCKVVWGVWFHGMAREDLDRVSFPPETPRDRVLSMDDLDPSRVQMAIDRLFASELAHGLQTRLDDADHDWILKDVLAPQIPGLCPSKRAKADFNEIVYKQLIREQMRVLDFLDGQRSAVVNGMAGTGKTFVALERTRRCAQRGERTLYLCFNTALRDYLCTEFGNLHHELANKVDFKTLDDFIATYSSPLSADFLKMSKEEKSEFQLARYLKAVRNLVAEPSQFPYTQVVVDEGQDCAIPYIEKSGILKTLKDVVVAKRNKTENASAFFMFYDAYQLVSLRADATAELPEVIREADCKLTLYKNCRNTHSIAQSAGSGILGEGRMPEMASGALPGTKPEVVFVDPKTDAEAYAGVVGRCIGTLRAEVGTEDIVVLSCSPFGDGYSRLEKRLSTKNRGQRMFNQAYRFSTYRKFKGLDASVVVLVDVDRSAFVGVHHAMPFYAGASRARQRLVVVASMADADCAEIVAAYSSSPKTAAPESARRKFVDLFHMVDRSVDWDH